MAGHLKKRDAKLDNCRSFLIFCVVLGHIIEIFLGRHIIFDQIYRVIYSFHMPAFVALAGMTSHAVLTRRRFENILTEILQPLVVFWLIYELCHYVIVGFVSNYITTFSPYWLLWFLLSLAIWRLLLPLILRTPFPVLASFIIALIAGFFSAFDQTLSLSRTAYFLPFFVMGHQLYRGSEGRGFAYLHSHFPLWAACGAMAIFAVWVIQSDSIMPREMFFGRDPYAEHYPEALLWGVFARALTLSLGIVGMACIFRIATSFNLRLGGRPQNSLWVYLWHGLPILAVSHGLTSLIADDARLSDLSAYSVLGLALIASYVICAVLSLPHIARWSRSIFLPLRLNHPQNLPPKTLVK